MPELSIFSPEHYFATRRPLLEASNLPGWCYTSGEWYDREMASIIRKEWILVGRAEDIPNPGDFLTLQVDNDPVVVVRDRTGVIRAHLAICRHRAALVAQGAGNCRSFVCPYHGWTYALDGELVATPGRQRPMDGAIDFDRGQNGLLPVRLEWWAGFMFITLGSDTPPLLERLGDLPSRLANYGMQNLVCTRIKHYEVDCNWKVYVENTTDEYHVEFLHRKHIGPEFPNLAIPEAPNGPFTLRHYPASITAPAQAPLPHISGLIGKQLVGAYTSLVYPNLYLMLSPTVVKYLVVLPVSVEKSRVTIAWCFPRDTTQATDFEQLAGKHYYSLTDPIVDEDNELTPSVQQGLRSPSRPAGRFSSQEYGIHAFENYVLDRVLGK